MACVRDGAWHRPGFMHMHEASQEGAGPPPPPRGTGRGTGQASCICMRQAGKGLAYAARAEALGVAFAWRGVALGVFVHMHEANQEEAGPLRVGGPIAGPLALRLSGAQKESRLGPALTPRDRCGPRPERPAVSVGCAWAAGTARHAFFCAPAGQK